MGCRTASGAKTNFIQSFPGSRLAAGVDRPAQLAKPPFWSCREFACQTASSLNLEAGEPGWYPRLVALALSSLGPGWLAAPREPVPMTAELLRAPKGPA